MVDVIFVSLTTSVSERSIAYSWWGPSNEGALGARRSLRANCRHWLNLCCRRQSGDARNIQAAGRLRTGWHWTARVPIRLVCVRC